MRNKKFDLGKPTEKVDPKSINQSQPVHDPKEFNKIKNEDLRK